MGRTNTNPVQRMYFVYNLEKNECTCQIINCPHPIRSGRHAGNLETHVKSFHKNEYQLLLKEKVKMSISKTASNVESETYSSILKVCKLILK